MSNIIEYTNLDDFLNKFGLAGYEIIKYEDIDDMNLHLLKLIDLERKGIIKFEFGLGFKVIAKNRELLTYSDKLILDKLENGILMLDYENDMKRCLVEELSNEGFLEKMTNDNRSLAVSHFLKPIAISLVIEIIFTIINILTMFKFKFGIACLLFGALAIGLGIYDLFVKTYQMDKNGYLLNSGAIKFRKRIKQVYSEKLKIDAKEYDEKIKYIKYKGGNN